MQFKMVIVDLELSTRAKRFAIALGIPAAVLMGAGAVAYADVPNSWKSGDVLTAASLNENFDDIDKRLAALSADPTYLVADSNVTESGTPWQDLVYQGMSLDLTPGTWLVEGFATLSTTINIDTVQVGLWDDTNAVEVPKSRSPQGVTLAHGGATSCDGITTFCAQVGVRTSSVITVASDTKIRLKGYRNGYSTLWFGPTGGALALPSGHRLTALRLK